MDWYEHEVRELEEQQRRTPAPRNPVVFYGSSSIRLWSTLERDFPDVQIANRAFGGSTMTACSWFYWRLVKPLSPSALVIYAGDNDLGDGQSPEEIVRQLGFLLGQLEASSGNIPVMLLSVKPSPARWHLVSQIRRTNALLRERVSAHQPSVFVDVFTEMIAHGAPRRELFADDGLHLSTTGYSLWRDAVQRHRSTIF